MLMGLAAWDSASLFISYNFIHLKRLGRWEGLSLGVIVILATWLSISYLLGRYSPASNGEKESPMGELGKTLAAGCGVIGVFVGHSWFYQVVDAQTRFRGFLIPLVLGACLLSTLGNRLRDSFAVKRQKWILLGNNKEMDAVLRELRQESDEVRTRTLVPEKNQYSEIWEESREITTGIAAGSFGKDDDLEIERLLRLREKGKRVIPLLGWCEQELQRIPPELVHSEWLMQAEGFGLRPGSISWRIKRLGDVLGALTVITVTAPVLVLGGLLIWLEDQGPIFYKQTRSGLYARPIRIWKLRSMRMNAEKAGAQWALKDDKRITRVGRVLRATRIDELPQLFSVLNGDLSLIGPRPERPEIEELLEKEIPNYRVRHWIRPGLSGWAQVCYPYGASIEDSRMKLSYDLYYLRNASWLLDILITLKTIRLVAGAKGSSPVTREPRD